MNTKLRFMGFVEKEPNSGCWIWTGAVLKWGYGRFQEHPKTSLAHRVSWRLFRGSIPNGIDVLHKCDIPCCVNPDHLFLGTDRDNHRDMARKGRGAKSRSGLPYGVSWHGGNRRKPWQATVCFLGKNNYLGSFATAEEAAAAAADYKRSNIQPSSMSVQEEVDK